MILLLFAFGLRIFQLDAQSIWWDEGISLHLATSAPEEIVADRLNNIHPPLYFFILKGWLYLTGVNTFNARYLSALASWLQVAAVLAIARRWFSWRTAVAAAVLATLSAVSVIYGQEIRVYAMLALIYLALLALTRELIDFRGAGIVGSGIARAGFKPAPTGGERGTGLWVALGLVTWIGLHMHYITFFVVGYVSLWAVLSFARQRRWRDLRRWLVLLFLVGVASLPWFLALWRNWSAVQGEANAGTFIADAVPFDFLLAQVWVFHLAGLAGALARPALRILAGATAVSLFLLVLVRFVQKGTRRDTGVLLANWLVPLCSALVVWAVRSFSHPRYVSMFVPGLILLAGYLILPPSKRSRGRWTAAANVLALMLAVAMIVSSLWGLWLYFADPGVAKANVRGVARYLEETAEAGDLILVPDTDWSLPFEYDGPATIAMPGLDDVEGGWSQLALLTVDTGRTFMMDYRRGTRDWQRLLPFALEKAGDKVAEVDFEGLVLQTYELEEAISAPQMTPEGANFGRLLLSDSWVEQGASSGDLVTVALRWRLKGPFAEDDQIGLRILDSAGWPVATEDALLLDREGRPTSRWRAGEAVTTYHRLAVPAGVAPLVYDVGLQVYVTNDGGVRPLDLLDEQNAPQGQEYLFAKTRLAAASENTARVQEEPLIAPWAQPAEVAPGLALLAGEVLTRSAVAGQPLLVRLLWQATAVPLPDLRPELALDQKGSTLLSDAAVPVNGRYPTTLWSKDEKVFEQRQLLIPADAAGAASVMLRVGNKALDLGEVDIISEEHSFDRPLVSATLEAEFGDLARLIGFDLLQDQIKQDGIVTLTLYWQALTTGSDSNYVVFTHILDEEGRLIGQHDSSPANSSRPTTGWLAGEFVVDAHDMVLRENDYRGQALIEIGLYDPVSGERLLLADGSDRLLLPVALNVE